MAKLKSELEVPCPCCGATLVIDTNLGRVIAHHEPEREDKPDLDAAQQILAEEQARREAIFQQSVEAEKTRGDALSRRFEEALRAGAAGADHEAEAGLRSGLRRQRRGQALEASVREQALRVEAQSAPARSGTPGQLRPRLPPA